MLSAFTQAIHKTSVWFLKVYSQSFLSVLNLNILCGLILCFSPGEPLIFIEVALLKNVAQTIQVNFVWT